MAVKHSYVAMAWMSAVTLSSVCAAQWREDEPPTMTPAVTAAETQPRDIGAFTARYSAAGSPRIVLFWNVSFDDQLQVAHEVRSTVERNSETHGSVRNSEIVTSRMGVSQVDSAKRLSPLSERNYAQLQTAFAQTLRTAGVRLLDRAALMRVTQMEKAKAVRGVNDSAASEINAKEVEAQAVVGKAELLTEILLVRDADAPLGVAFKVSVKNIKQGTEIASMYTLAAPEIVQPPGEYVATDTGFEWRQSAALSATAADVGAQLAYELMMVMGREL